MALRDLIFLLVRACKMKFTVSWLKDHLETDVTGRIVKHIDNDWFGSGRNQAAV